MLIFNNTSRNFPAQSSHLSWIWCKMLAQYQVMQSVTAVRSVLVEGKERRVWFVFYSAANSFANCTISYSWYLSQEQNQAISAEVSSQYKASTKSPDSSVCWFLTFPNQSCCGNSCLVSPGPACEYHISDKGYASTSTLLTPLVLLLFASVYCKKHIAQRKKHCENTL